jgi:hypothetical protein
MELSELKRDKQLLLAYLGIEREGTNMTCPFHGGKGSFSVYQHEGIYMWKCHAGCQFGTIIDAAMRKTGASDYHAAVMVLERELGIVIGKNEEYAEPIIDTARANAFIDHAHETLLNSPEQQEMYMRDKRGLSLDVVKQYRIGFAQNIGITGKNWNVFGWVLPVTDANGALLGVKLHTEKPLWVSANKPAPKAMWAPFGTYPASDPHHGTKTLWPAPEVSKMQQSSDLYICPGELKALALISAGKWATSPTTGESKMPERLVQRIVRCQPDRVFIPYDDDKPKLNKATGQMVSAGNNWKDAMIDALSEVGIAATCFRFHEVIPELKCKRTKTGKPFKSGLYHSPFVRPAKRPAGAQITKY